MSYILGAVALGLLIIVLILRSRLKEEKKSLEASINENTRLDKKSQMLESKLEVTEKELQLVNAELTKLKSQKDEEKQPSSAAVVDDKVKLPFFEKFMDSDKQYRWRFKAKNNKIIADSGEGYTTKQNLEKGMKSLVEAISSGMYRVKEKDSK